MNPFSFLRRCSICLTVLFTLTLNPAAVAQNTAGMPEWLADAMAAEQQKLKYKKVAMGEDYLTTRMAGKPLGQPQSLEGGWYLSSDIGTPAPLECWVFWEAVDPATLAVNIANASMQASAQANGTLGNQSVHFVDAGAYDNAPYLALEWLYTVGDAPNAMVGLAKVRVATVDSATVGCAHNLVGYRTTFADAFETFVRKASVTSDQPAPYYEEVVVQKIAGQSIGFAHTTFTRDEEGDTQIVMLESMLIPVDSSTVSTTDAWHSSFSTAEGSLINQVSATSENGELTTNLSLDPTDTGWAVSGVFQGKEIYQEIESSTQPVSDIGQRRAVQHLLTDSNKSDVTMSVWIPAADPTRFMEAGISMDASGREDGRGTLTLGPMAIAAQFDATGSLLNGQIDAGNINMAMERVWADGTPP